MDTLPVLISIPHGGSKVPEEVRDRIGLLPIDILDDGDAFTGDIYDVGDAVRHVVKASAARAFVDLNRSRDDLPPGNPDGVVKTHTCYGKQVYRNGCQPDRDLTQLLLNRHYDPYHSRLQHLLSGENPSGIRLALDCHSMAAVGPEISPDPGKKRPAFCLGNLRGRTCPQSMLDTLADCLRQAFGLRDSDVTQNVPFAGGHITRAYGGKPIPWIQVEMSRDLYLRPPYFERETMAVDPSRIRELNTKFEQVLQLFFDTV